MGLSISPHSNFLYLMPAFFSAAGKFVRKQISVAALTGAALQNDYFYKNFSLGLFSLILPGFQITIPYDAGAENNSILNHKCADRLRPGHQRHRAAIDTQMDWELIFGAVKQNTS